MLDAKDRDDAPGQRLEAEGASPMRASLLLLAARVLRDGGLDKPSLEDIARVADMAPEDVRALYPDKEALVHAIFEDVILKLQASDETPWYGYGGGIRRSLAVTRTMRDGYLLLLRQGAKRLEYQRHVEALRRRGARLLRGLLWFPDPAPRRDARPPFLDLAVDSMSTFGTEALAYWLEHGEASRDELYIRWYAQTIKAWRHNTAELLNLDSPDADWPFDTENSEPLRRHSGRPAPRRET